MADRLSDEGRQERADDAEHRSQYETARIVRARRKQSRDDPGNKADVIDYVLTRAPRAEEDTILETVSTAADVMPLLLEQGSERAMTRLHSRAGKT